MNNSTHEFERLLGKAALALWSDFPREVQETPFRNGCGRGHNNSKPFSFVPARPPSENGTPRKADAVSLGRGQPALVCLEFPARLLCEEALVVE